MSWLTTSEIRAKFNIAGSSFADQIAAASASAALMMRREWITADIYAEAIGDALASDNENYLRQMSVIESHSYLTMWFLYGNVGHKLAAEGVIKQAQSSASVAADKVMMNQYLTPADLESLKNEMLVKAKDVIRLYAIEDFDGGVIIESNPLDAIQSGAWF